MERWRIFALATLLSVVFLAGLFLVAEAGHSRLRAASEDLHAAMAHRVLVAEFREGYTEAALSYRSFLATGQHDYLATLAADRRRVGVLADRLVDDLRGKDQDAARAASELRYLVGVQAGSIDTALELYDAAGLAAARAMAQSQRAATDPALQLARVCEQLERHADAQIRGAEANWRHEVAFVRQLALIGTAMNIVLVAGASVFALAALRRYLASLSQVARRRDELELEASAQAAELNEVYGHLQTVQEQERSRLARGLHDELGGLLLAARMDLSWLRQHAADAAPNALTTRLDRVLEMLDQGIDLKRRVIEELHPTLLDNVGLLAALRWQVEETSQQAGLDARCEFPEQEPEITPRAAITLFRVVQEALANVQKQASARHVVVRLDVTATSYVLSIRDDGRGIVAAGTTRGEGHGVAGMRHRMNAAGGALMTGTGQDGGFEVRALLPRATSTSAETAPRVARQEDLRRRRGRRR
jgi:signal transduction histidine kinase